MKGNGIVDGTDAIIGIVDYRTAATVEDFGAVGDGITDDTAAIQAAMRSGKNLILYDGTKQYRVGYLALPAGTALLEKPPNGESHHTCDHPAYKNMDRTPLKINSIVDELREKAAETMKMVEEDAKKHVLEQDTAAERAVTVIISDLKKHVSVPRNLTRDYQFLILDESVRMLVLNKLHDISIMADQIKDYVRIPPSTWGAGIP
jgi:hypothetical protein